MFLEAFSTYFTFERFLLISLILQCPSDKVLFITLQNLYSSRETLYCHSNKRKQKNEQHLTISALGLHEQKFTKWSKQKCITLHIFNMRLTCWVMCTNRTWQGQTAHLSWLTVSMFWVTQACEGLRSLLPHYFIVVWPGEESRMKETGRREDWDKHNGALT